MTGRDFDVTKPTFTVLLQPFQQIAGTGVQLEHPIVLAMVVLTIHAHQLVGALGIDELHLLTKRLTYVSRHLLARELHPQHVARSVTERLHDQFHRVHQSPIEVEDGSQRAG